MGKTLNIGIIGYQFMGKAHSNAYLKAARFFDLEVTPNLKVACGRHEAPLRQFASRWGWEDTETSWEKMVTREDIDLIDISSPTHMHKDIVIAAASAGKHILCEKPMALNADEARQMVEAVQAAGVKHMLGHNYRRVPAVQLAKQFIDAGKIGDIYHWRGAYLQDWIVDPGFPLTWHLRKETAGYGPHADLNSHSVDLARYLVGEIASIQCKLKTFVHRRSLPDPAMETAFEAAASEGTGEVNVDDASLMIVEFDNGALGSFEASRFALGRKNYNHFEIYGGQGSLGFNLERMNELEYFSGQDDDGSQGFKTVMVTESNHPYISSWWPPGHIIGYEHTFVHEVVDFLRCIYEDKEATPNFHDGLRCMQVLDAAALSNGDGMRVDVNYE
jgi:predicted dehydrogenase